jgi:excisionase family DNA binding protein
VEATYTPGLQPHGEHPQPGEQRPMRKLPEQAEPWLRAFFDAALGETATLRSNGANEAAAARDRVLDQLLLHLGRWLHTELTPAEAAAEAGVCEETIRRKVRAGQIVDHRPKQGGRHRVRRADLAPLAHARKRQYDPLADARDIAGDLRRLG